MRRLLRGLRPVPFLPTRPALLNTGRDKGTGSRSGAAALLLWLAAAAVVACLDVNSGAAAERRPWSFVAGMIVGGRIVRARRSGCFSSESVNRSEAWRKSGSSGYAAAIVTRPTGRGQFASFVTEDPVTTRRRTGPGISRWPRGAAVFRCLSPRSPGREARGLEPVLHSQPPMCG